MPRITISEPGRTPQPYRLKTDRKITKIGRGSNNDVILETGSASTHHCDMLRVDGGFILKDNDSTNGILLEDTRFKIIDLVDGITVSIGDDIDFSFELSEEELELLEKEDFEPQQQAAFPRPKKKAVSLDDEEDDDDDDEYEEVVIRRKKKKKAVSLLDDDEDDEEIVKPKKKAAVKSEAKPEPKVKASSYSKPRTVAPMASSKPSGAGTTILFAILAVVFLVGGMVIRHYQDHGTFLFEKQIKK